MHVITAGMPPRVAVRTDAARGLREDVLFLPVHGDEMFCVLHRPAGLPRGGVVICSSLFAEQLKLYRAEVLAGRALAGAGFAVVRLHYRGTGHSGGRMERVTLGSMLEDTFIAANFLSHGAPGVPLAFCGARWGGLVAGLAAARQPRAPLVLWEPVVRGRRADALADPLHRALFMSAADQHLIRIADAGPRPILLVQVSLGAQLKPELAALASAFRAHGCPVDTATIEAEEARSSLGWPVQSTDALIHRTTLWLRQALGAQPS